MGILDKFLGRGAAREEVSDATPEPIEKPSVVSMPEELKEALKAPAFQPGEKARDFTSRNSIKVEQPDSSQEEKPEGDTPVNSLGVHL